MQQFISATDGNMSVTAFQVNGQGIGEGHELIKRCTREAGKLTAVPEGLEVFGSTIAGVKVGDAMIQVSAGDYVVFVNGDARLVLDSFSFDQMYKKVD